MTENQEGIQRDLQHLIDSHDTLQARCDYSQTEFKISSFCFLHLPFFENKNNLIVHIPHAGGLAACSVLQ